MSTYSILNFLTITWIATKLMIKYNLMRTDNRIQDYSNRYKVNVFNQYQLTDHKSYKLPHSI